MRILFAIFIVLILFNGCEIRLGDTLAIHSDPIEIGRLR